MAALRPKVNIEVQSALNLTAPSGPGIIAMIGTAQWGPMNTVTSVDNLSQGIGNFKDDINEGSDSSLTMIKGLDLAFSNGASEIKCVRIHDGDATSSTLVLQAGSTDVITVLGKYSGTYGDNVAVTITANSVNAARIDLEVSDGVNIETYSNSGVGYTSNTDIVTALNAQSNLVAANLDENTYLVDTLSQTNLTGGDNGENTLVASDWTTAIDNQLNNEDFDLLCIPGNSEDSFHTTVVGKLNTRASSEDKFSQFVSGIAKDETIATAQARTASGIRLSIVSPNVKTTHRITGSEQILDGSYLACAYGGIIAKNWPEISATHKVISVVGLSILESAGTEFYNNSEQNQLLNSRIVPITKIGGSLMASRAVTRHADVTSVYYEENIVSIVDYVQAQVITLLNGYIGQPNLERVRTVIAKNIDGILEGDKREEIIASYQATEVEVATSPDTITVTMSILPTFAINFIEVTLTLENS